MSRPRPWSPISRPALRTPSTTCGGRERPRMAVGRTRVPALEPPAGARRSEASTSPRDRWTSRRQPSDVCPGTGDREDGEVPSDKGWQGGRRPSPLVARRDREADPLPCGAAVQRRPQPAFEEVPIEPPSGRRGELDRSKGREIAERAPGPTAVDGPEQVRVRSGGILVHHPPVAGIDEVDGDPRSRMTGRAVDRSSRPSAPAVGSSEDGRRAEVAVLPHRPSVHPVEEGQTIEGLVTPRPRRREFRPRLPSVPGREQSVMAPPASVAHVCHHHPSRGGVQVRQRDLDRVPVGRVARVSHARGGGRDDGYRGSFGRCRGLSRRGTWRPGKMTSSGHQDPDEQQGHGAGSVPRQPSWYEARTQRCRGESRTP